MCDFHHLFYKKPSLLHLFLLMFRSFQLRPQLLIEIIFDVIVVPIILPDIYFVFNLFAVGPICVNCEIYVG